MAEYTDVPEMTERLGADADASRLKKAISASARVIEDACGGPRGRRVFTLDIETSPRLFRIRDNVLTEPGGQLLLVDDIGNLTGIIVEIGDGVTWETVTDYRAEPLNALARGEPITELRRVNQQAFLPARWVPEQLVAADPLARVTTRWGWPAVPEAVPDANRILAERYYRRKDAWAGVAGFGESGLARLQAEDPDVAMQIEPYIRQGL